MSADDEATHETYRVRVAIEVEFDMLSTSKEQAMKKADEMSAMQAIAAAATSGMYTTFEACVEGPIGPKGDT